MAISVARLVEQTRFESGLRSNQLFDDDRIATFLTEGYWELRDLMVVRFEHWFRDVYTFTLTDGSPGNTLDLRENVPTLEMVQGLDWVDSSGNHFTISMLPSFANRNAANGIWPMVGPGWNFSGYLGRAYYLDGTKLIVVPPQNASGDYELIFTPQGEQLALPITVDFAIATGDTPQVPPPGSLVGTGAWLLANATDPGDIPLDGGFDLTLAFTVGPPDNTPFSGTYNVVGFGGAAQGFGQPTFGCSNLASVSGFANPAHGTGTFTYQPVGTIGDLPEELTPWYRYIVLYASKIIRASRRQPWQDLELQFQQVRARVVSVTKQRSEGIRQAPITRGNYGGGGR